MSAHKDHGYDLTIMTRDELRKVAADLKIAGRGSMLKEQLIEAIALKRDTDALRGTGTGEPLGVLNEPKTTTTVYPPEVMSSQIHTYASVAKPMSPSGQGVPMSNGKRRLNYFMQNGVVGMTRFTPRQRRRYAKKALRNEIRQVEAAGAL